MMSAYVINLECIYENTSNLDYKNKYEKLKYGSIRTTGL